MMSGVRYALTVVLGLLGATAIATPAFASGEITVASVTVEIHARTPSGADQQITSTVRGFTPQVSVDGVGAALVNAVTIKGTAAQNGIDCNPSPQGWSCPGELDPGGVIDVKYFSFGNADSVATGSFTVTMTMGDNGKTFTGSSTSHVTRAPADWAFTEALEQFNPPPSFTPPKDGLITLAARNNGPEFSDVTMTVNGLDAGPIEMNEGSCTPAGSTLTCASQGLSSVQPGPNDVFAIQFVDRSPNWRALKLVATLTPQHNVPDSNPANNTVVLGPFSPPSGGGATGGRPSASAGPASTAPSPTAASPAASGFPVVPADTASSPPVEALPLDASDTSPPDTHTAIYVASLVIVLAGVGLLLLVLIRRRFAVDVGPSSPPLESPPTLQLPTAQTPVEPPTDPAGDD
jgi:hypothetical protein